MLISGISLSQADVGMTMLRMNQYPQFSHVDLDNLQRQNVPGAAPSASPTIGPCQFQMTLELSPISSGNSSGTTLGNDNVQKS
jgi:hypothetical protein